MINDSSSLKKYIAKRLHNFISHWGVGVDKNVETYKELGVQIGQDVFLNNVSFDPLYPELISIGDNVTITYSTILTHDDSAIIWKRRRRIAPVKIGSNVFIGFGSIILPGVSIGDDCIVGAHSVVSRDVPEKTVVAGNPAKFIKTINQYQADIMNSDTLFDFKVALNQVSKEEDIQMKQLVKKRYRPDLVSDGSDDNAS